jgi:hypothetical protein
MSTAVLAPLILLLAGWAGPFRAARVELPADLVEVAPTAVAGANPRAWRKPLRFGEYATAAVHDGTVFSWSVELFGVRGGKASRAYRLTLDGPSGTPAEVECRTRAIDAWRNGWSVELTEAFAPRLACGIRPADDSAPARLVLGSNGRRLEGRIEPVGGPALEVVSLHRLAGSPLPSDGPAGYALAIGGRTRAAVEVLNRGRVWIDPELDASTRDLAAAAIAALLLFDPELSPEAFGPEE